MVVTNAITFLSYVSICLTLLILAKRTRRVIARDWAYFVIGFALFIVACGSTHLLEVITTWNPIFWVDAGTNIVTAALSAWVALMLIRRASAIGFGINDYATRLANSERENKAMQDGLLAAHRLEDWSRMSTVLAHEINNPLEAIQNMLYLIRTSDGIPGDVAGLAQAAEDETMRVIDISRSTLSFFRQAAEREVVDLAAAAEAVKFLVAPLLQRQRINFEVLAAGDTEVLAFPGEVRQVLLNLVRNACEATTRIGTTISVQLTGTSSGVEVVVADEGAGIETHLLPTLFQFGASTKGSHGNGMGLWTVKHILSRHAGTVQVESRPGAGTRFTLWWPRNSGDTYSVETSQIASAQPSAQPA
jgi:signal transduction histidine kinase